jgi:hypothetical protein
MNHFVLFTKFFPQHDITHINVAISTALHSGIPGKGHSVLSNWKVDWRNSPIEYDSDLKKYYPGKDCKIIAATDNAEEFLEKWTSLEQSGFIRNPDLYHSVLRVVLSYV